MRRLVSVLAAGVLAAGTVLGTVAVASAGPATARQTCTIFEPDVFYVTSASVSYFLGTPNNTFAGATVRLKPRVNTTTQWIPCGFSGTHTDVFSNRGLALTSRSLTPGQNVTVEPAGNGGNGFASQRWDFVFSNGADTFQNEKTHLFLRVRNGGPIMGQTVTTGRSATAWTVG
jgi:hypothetical protein